MHGPHGRLSIAEVPNPAPWTTAGGPDLAFDEIAREERRASLTDPRLVERFRLIDPHAEPVYEHMIRALDLVWECPDDSTVNVVGYRCAGCGSSREVATLAALCRDGAPEPTTIAAADEIAGGLGKRMRTKGRP